jgi:hypothetical protein
MMLKNKNKKELKVWTLNLVEEKNNLIKLLKKYVDVFTSSLANMFRVDTNIVVHEILLILGGRPVKQKLRIIRP